MRRIATVGLTLALILGSAVPALAGGPPRDEDGNRMRVVVYVESQDLYFDSIVGPDLPMKGNFQELKPGDAPNGGLATEFGPGDPGYLGGRWWVDVNGDHQMDADDHYFSCPLLGPGRSAP